MTHEQQATITIEHLEAAYIREDNVAMVHAGRYADDSPAWILQDGTTGEPVATVTVCMIAYGVKPDSGAILVKDYAENEGLAAALVAADVIRPTGRTFDAGFARDGVVEAVIIR